MQILVLNAQLIIMTYLQFAQVINVLTKTEKCVRIASLKIINVKIK